jgi:hypothetical protein
MSTTTAVAARRRSRCTGRGHKNVEGTGNLTIAIPASASPGINAVIGVGQTTSAIGVGGIKVQ